MLTLTLASAFLLSAPVPKDWRKPADPPDGEWVAERFEVDGYSYDPNFGVRKARDSFTPTKWEAKSSSGVQHSELVAWFEAGKTLHADFFPGDPKKEAKGIWKVEGDTLTICRARPGQQRPSEFTAPKGSGRELLVFKRVTK